MTEVRQVRHQVVTLLLFVVRDGGSGLVFSHVYVRVGNCVPCTSSYSIDGENAHLRGALRFDIRSFVFKITRISDFDEAQRRVLLRGRILR